jgi:hypothetical protein
MPPVVRWPVNVLLKENEVRREEADRIKKENSDRALQAKKRKDLWEKIGWGVLIVSLASSCPHSSSESLARWPLLLYDHAIDDCQ